MNKVDAVVETLILDLIEWLATRQRTYQEAMEAWRTSCPRFPVWEEANSRGLVMILSGDNESSVVAPTSLGLILLEQRREDARQLRSSRFHR